MANTYNPYSDVKGIYDLKVQWDEANKSGDKNKANSIAANAQVYYDNLINNKYSGVANALKSVGSVDAKSILDKYSPEVTTETQPKTVETTLKEGNDGTVEKYNQTYENLLNTNPFKTDESKAILGKYDLAGLYARDNAVASGGASNGGNIDSYAAANAMRQQASLISQGQSAVLEAHQQKIDNVRGLLSDMGVNLDRIFNQNETAKNNDVARKSEIANVTGYVPTEWTYDNNIYLNSDGTVKDEFMTTEFDSTGGFTTIINNAKAKLATTTDATERANLIATINAATQAKALKTFSSPKYSQYAHEVTNTSATPTEAHRQFDEQSKLAADTLAAEKEATAAGYQNEIDKINAQTQGQKDILEFSALMNGGNASSFTDDETKVVNDVVSAINSTLKNHASNTGKIDLIVKLGGGKYSFTTNPNGLKYTSVTSWKGDIIPIIYKSGLTPEQKAKLYYQIGFSKDDVEDVYTAKGWATE